MIVISRMRNEALVIGDGDQKITVTVVEIRGDKVRLGIDSPPVVPVCRREVGEAIQQSEGIQREKEATELRQPAEHVTGDGMTPGGSEAIQREGEAVESTVHVTPDEGGRLINEWITRGGSRAIVAGTLPEGLTRVASNVYAIGWVQEGDGSWIVSSWDRAGRRRRDGKPDQDDLVTRAES